MTAFTIPSPFEIFRTPITIYRYTGGSYVNGYWVEDVRTAIQTTASIQAVSGTKNNISGIDINLFPEGRNNTKVYTLYTSFEIKTVTDQNPDQVVIFGDTFEVIQVKPWQNNSLFIPVNHYKYVAMSPDTLLALP
jgi:hypothetical protein